MLEEALAIRAEALPPEHPDIGEVCLHLGLLRLQQSEPSLARELLERSRRLRAGVLPEDDEEYGLTVSALGLAIALTGGCAEAEPLVLDGHRIIDRAVKKAKGRPSTDVDRAAGRVIAMYEHCGSSDKAAQFRARLGAPSMAE